MAQSPESVHDPLDEFQHDVSSPNPSPNRASSASAVLSPEVARSCHLDNFPEVSRTNSTPDHEPESESFPFEFEFLKASRDVDTSPSNLHFNALDTKTLKYDKYDNGIQESIALSDCPISPSDGKAPQLDAIRSLLGSERLNDNAVTQSLQWESRQANNRVAVLDSFDLISQPWTSRKIQRFRSQYTTTKRFLAPIYYTKLKHWSLVLVDLDKATIEHYDSCAFRPRFEALADEIQAWMATVDPKLKIREVKSYSKVSSISFHFVKFALTRPRPKILA